LVGKSLESPARMLTAQRQHPSHSLCFDRIDVEHLTPTDSMIPERWTSAGVSPGPSLLFPSSTHTLANEDFLELRERPDDLAKEDTAQVLAAKRLGHAYQLHLVLEQIFLDPQLHHEVTGDAGHLRDQHRLKWFPFGVGIDYLTLSGQKFLLSVGERGHRAAIAWPEVGSEAPC
jgi:hypothetical protein